MNDCGAYQVELTNRQMAVPIQPSQLTRAVQLVLRDARLKTASVSLAVVDDPTIHQLNRRYLNHDYPTDVLSFVLDSSEEHLVGEVILSADTAARQAPHHQWAIDSELLLYVVHGALHLVGHRDAQPEEARAMWQAQGEYLVRFGVAAESVPVWSGTARESRAASLQQGELAL